MDILKQCQEWHENDKYQEIVDALEAIPVEERCPELDSELARAYNNLANAADPTDKALLRRAIALLKPHEEYFQGDHAWNFRMGYAYYYLDQEAIALRYFTRALEARPGDEDTQEFIEWCRNYLSLPHFEENFRERTVNAWSVFAQREAELRRIMDEDKNHENGEELIARCSEILELAFDNISFEMGFNGEKHELILTAEGDKVKLFELVYFQRHAPAVVLEKWNILVGRQPIQTVGLRSGNWEISSDDVQVWVEKLEDRVSLTLYCEKLLPELEHEENRVWWMLTTVTDMVLGEIASMAYIDSFDVVSAPKEEPSWPLSRLPKALQEMGLKLEITPEEYLERYTGYRMEPNQDPEADWRLDVIAGSTSCPSIINGYLKSDDEYMDRLHADGVVAGFLCYPLDKFDGEDRSQQIFAFRDALEEALMEKAGEEALTLIGGATGIYCGYVDFIAWDLPTVLSVAEAFFEAEKFSWASFHVFRRDSLPAHVWMAKETDADSE